MFGENGFCNNGPHTAWPKDSHQSGDGMDEEDHEIAHPLSYYTRTLPKGTHVVVQGTLRSREYESDLVQRRIFELRVDTVAKLDRAERKEEESAPSDI